MKTTEKNTIEKNTIPETESLSALVAKAKTGDQEAFSELYDKTSAELYRSIRAMTRDEDLSWDIQQDAYLHAYQKLNTLDSNEAFFPWLRRIAVNATVSRMRQRRALTFTELAGEDDGTPELPDLNPANQPELSLDRKETSRLVQEILSKLPEEQQLIVGMRYYDELSVKEIANTLSISEGAVKAQLFHGRKKVESAVRALEKQGIKLYGLSPVAFLMALMRRMEPAAAESGKQAAVKAAVTKVSADAAAATAVPVAAKTFGQVLAGRVLAGALAVAPIGGGIWGGAKLLKNNQRDNPYQPTTVEINERLSGVETPEEIPETNEDLPVITEPVVTAPSETNPAVTEPVGTEPVGTDPSGTEPVTTEPTKPVRADNECGEHLTWRFDPDYCDLYLEGSGDMDDYAGAEDAPWHAYQNEIRYIRIADGVTSIGDNAFAGCVNLRWFSQTRLTRIGAGAFEGCENLIVELPMTLTSIGDRAFSGCTKETYLFLTGSLREISDTAFRGCEGLSLIVCSADRSKLDLDVFSDCAGLREIWVLNPEITVSGRLEDPSQITICGLPGSTAEHYAGENNIAFASIADNRDAVTEILRNERYDNFTRLSMVLPFGERYLARVEHAKPVLATEAEFQQAQQSGTIVLNGRAYRFTESLDRAKEWGFVYESLLEHIPAVAWIALEDGIAAGQDDNVVYSVVAAEEGYYFRINERYQAYEHVLRTEYENIGWLWLDADTKIASFIDGAVEGLTLDDVDDTLDNVFRRNKRNNVFSISSIISLNDWLHVTEDGEFYIYEPPGGRR